MGRPEGAIEAYLVDRVKALGGEVRKVQWIGRKGAPDRLIWWDFPHVAFVEVKAPGVDLDHRSLQGREIARMRRDGWPVYVVNSREQVDFVLDMVRSGLTYE